MKAHQESNSINIEGEHEIHLARQKLWESMNNPEILQRCIKGCNQVERVSEDAFLAKFKLHIGPFKKIFHAQLRIEGASPPDHYRLVSTMDAGIAGMVDGVADVKLEVLSEEVTKLRYQAQVVVDGWIGELGVKVLGSAAERYMQRFFDKIVEVLDDQ